MQILRNMFRALRHRNFAVFCSGQIISLIGSWMQALALSWLIFRLTGSSTQLGAVTFCSQIPVLLFSPFGGIVADRYPKRSVLLATQSAYMVLTAMLALLTLTDLIQIWHIYCISVLTGIVTSMDLPARQAFIVNMVEGKEDLANAIVINSSMVNGARLIGPSVAGLLVAWLGEGYCFLLNSASYIAVLTSLINITVTGHVVGNIDGNPLKSIRDGIRFVVRNQPISSLMLVVAIMSVNSSAHTVLMPIFSSEVLGGDSKTMGILLAFEGIGALIGALALACRREVKGMDVIISVASISCGILLLGLSCSRQIWQAALCLVPLGMTILGQLSTTNTLVQHLTPDHMRGRIMSIHGMMFIGLHPVGAFIYGILADRIGIVYTLALSGIALFLGSLRFIFTLRSWRIRAQRMEKITERVNQAMRS